MRGMNVETDVELVAADECRCCGGLTVTVSGVVGMTLDENGGKMFAVVERAENVNTGTLVLLTDEEDAVCKEALLAQANTDLEVQAEDYAERALDR